MRTREVNDDLDETQPFPPSVLDEHWEWAPPVDAIRAALAEEPVNREAVTEVLSRVADEANEDARRTLVEEIAGFVESRASDHAEGERLAKLARQIRSAFSRPATPKGTSNGHA